MALLLMQLLLLLRPVPLLLALPLPALPAPPRRALLQFQPMELGATFCARARRRPLRPSPAPGA